MAARQPGWGVPGEGDLNRHQQLGHFLRSRRTRLDPADYRLPSSPRRRTPGLRREEVAEMAGMGMSWYTSLEQGRDVHPSREALQRLAEVLRLNPDEMTYLLLLAGHSVPQAQQQTPSLAVSPSLQRTLNALQGTPAYVVNRCWDRIAWNRAAVALLGDPGLDSPADRNLIRKLFTNPGVRMHMPDWENEAQVVLGEFHSTSARHPDDPAIGALVAELNASSCEFRTWWPRQHVLARREKRVRLLDRRVGLMVLELSCFVVSYDEDLTLCLYTPLPDEESPAKLRQLLAAP